MNSGRSNEEKKSQEEKQGDSAAVPRILAPRNNHQEDSSSTERGKSKPIDSELEYKHHTERMEGEGGPVISSQNKNGHYLTSALEKTFKNGQSQQ